MCSRFQKDLKQQQKVRDLVLGPGLYERFHVGRYVYVDKGRLAEELQRRACDTLVNNARDELVAIEEKIVRWPVKEGKPATKPYTAVVLEEMSCTVEGHESPGWMHEDHESVADWLNYVMCQNDGTVVCHLVPFQELKAAFWPAREEFQPTTTTQFNKTLCRMVPLNWIKDAGIKVSRKRIHPLPEGIEAVKAYNASHYRLTP